MPIFVDIPETKSVLSLTKEERKERDEELKKELDRFYEANSQEDKETLKYFYEKLPEIKKEVLTKKDIEKVINLSLKKLITFDEFDLMGYKEGRIIRFIEAEEVKKTTKLENKKAIALYLLLLVRKSANGCMDGTKSYVYNLYNMERDLLKIIKPYINCLKIYKEMKKIKKVKVSEKPYFFTVKVVRYNHLIWQETKKPWDTMSSDDEI